MAKIDQTAFDNAFPANPHTGERSANLYSDANGADKCYQVWLRRKGDAYVVDFSFGARLGTQKPGTKTAAPVSLEKATSEFTKLVVSKITGSSKYRQEHTPNSAYIAPVDGRVPTGIALMFPVTATSAQVEHMLSSELWCMQEKKDGENCAVHSVPGEFRVVASNKLGFERGQPSPIADALLPFVGVCLNGELIGDTLHVFDILNAQGGRDMRLRPYRERVQAMESVIAAIKCRTIVSVPTYYTTAEKRAAYAALKARRAEGVVFKLLDSTYQPGKNPAAGVWKDKFTESATLLVTGHSQGKRSVRIGAYDENGNLTEMCNVSIPNNYAIPAIGQYVEVAYLYAYPGTNALAQPVYLGERHDQKPSSCVLSQLKFRASPDEDDVEEQVAA